MNQVNTLPQVVYPGIAVLIYISGILNAALFCLHGELM